MHVAITQFDRRIGTILYDINKTSDQVIFEHLETWINSNQNNFDQPDSYLHAASKVNRLILVSFSSTVSFSLPLTYSDKSVAKAEILPSWAI